MILRLILGSRTVRPATTLLEDARAIAEEAGLAAPTVLRKRSAYRASCPLGKAVVETEPEGKAAQEILEFKNWVLGQLHVCTPSTSQPLVTAANG